LAACLRAEVGCLGADLEALRSEASRLSGVRALRAGPQRCFLATASGPCSKLERNPETGDPAEYLKAAAKEFPLRYRAAKDLERGLLASCALVANGPLVKVARNGAAVDAHESVWRFNLMAGGKEQAPWAGSKTTVRVFNRLRGIEAAGIREGGRSVKLSAGDKEQWLFWSAASSVYIGDIKRRYPMVRTGLLHGSLVAWMLKVYFLLRQNLVELGLGEFPCPESLSSGIHSAFLATQVCQRTNLFGFSYSSEVLRTRPGHMDKHHTMHTAHSWELDVLVIRLLHLAGDLSVCSADDPSLDLKTLRSGSAEQ
jgi:hypothetical protein